MTTQLKKLIGLSRMLSFGFGVALIVAGGAGILFTRENVRREHITTPSDASIPQHAVEGPLTLKAQADIIREHMLKTSGGKTFAEMPREIPKLDQAGTPILGADGKPVMTANTSRDLWITATSLITALNLGILAYALCGLTIFLGFLLMWVAYVLGVLLRYSRAL